MALNVRRRLDIPHGLSNLLRYVNVLLPSSGAEADTRAVLPENQASTLFQVVESPAPCLCFAARNMEVDIVARPRVWCSVTALSPGEIDSTVIKAVDIPMQRLKTTTEAAGKPWRSSAPF